jgi:hypothetical protein
MISLVLVVVVGVRMDKGAQRAPIDDEPGDESAELGRSEDVHFEHRQGMWSDGPIPDLIDPKFRNWIQCMSEQDWYPPRICEEAYIPSESVPTML